MAFVPDLILDKHRKSPVTNCVSVFTYFGLGYGKTNMLELRKAVAINTSGLKREKELVKLTEVDRDLAFDDLAFNDRWPPGETACVEF